MTVPKDAKLKRAKCLFVSLSVCEIQGYWVATQLKKSDSIASIPLIYNLQSTALNQIFYHGEHFCLFFFVPIMLIILV